MKFKVDENLPVEVATLLRQAHHDTLTVHEQNMAGKSDTRIASICQEEQRILITLDTDFADIRSYPPDQYSGIIVLRLELTNKYHVLGIIQRLISTFPQESLENRLWIVEEHRIRIRGGETAE